MGTSPGRRRAGSHRAAPGGARRASPVRGARRADPSRARRGLGALGGLAGLASAAAVTAVVVLGGAVAGGLGAGERAADPVREAESRRASEGTDTDGSTGRRIPAMAGLRLEADGTSAAVADSTALPADSGRGRRVVFSESRQRVWLVGGDGRVQRTYLVSGSLYDNLDPGRYEVFSRSRNAVGIDDSGTMEYFVRFTLGDEGAAIGFHTIPVDDGRPVQRVADLGTPRSHGCIRQRRVDAVALWRFADLGTRVVVTP
ncbi:L,D-transpeptidase [Nocardioides sp.]|uniref:L,D-transpeptidase n=1 Tax=Nocardioides sp. TaxID=35761 RepID=UPI003515F1E3